MTIETLQKAKEIDERITDLKSRIKAISAIDSGDADCSRIKLEVQSRDKQNRNDYQNDSFSSSLNLNEQIQEKVSEELIDCATRIKRVFEKEIKNLQKEFEKLQ